MGTLNLRPGVLESEVAEVGSTPGLAGVFADGPAGRPFHATDPWHPAATMTPAQARRERAAAKAEAGSWVPLGQLGLTPEALVGRLVDLGQHGRGEVESVYGKKNSVRVAKGAGSVIRTLALKGDKVKVFVASGSEDGSEDNSEDGSTGSEGGEAGQPMSAEEKVRRPE